MKKLTIENGGIEQLIRQDSQFVRSKIEECSAIIAEALEVEDIEIFSFDGKKATIVTPEGTFISCNATVSEYGDLELDDFAIVEEGTGDEEGRRKILEQLVENVLNNNLSGAEEAWEQLVEAYRPFVIKGKIGRRHVSRAYYKMRRKSSGKGIVRSRRTGGIIRRMTGRERQKRKYSSRRTARRGSTKRNRARSLKRRQAFRLKNVKFENVDFAAALFSESMATGIAEANSWLESCFLSWSAEEPAVATLYEGEEGLEALVIESISGYNSQKRDYDAFVASKAAVVEGRRTARKLHRDSAFQEQVMRLTTEDCTTDIAEDISTQFPSVAYIGPKSLTSQFAYCLGKAEERVEVPAEKLNELAEAIVSSAWEFNPTAVQNVAQAAEGWLFPEDYELPDDALEAWQHITERFDMALIAEAKEARDIVKKLFTACADAKKAIEAMLPGEPAMYPTEDETVIRGIHNVLQSHCSTLTAYHKNPSSVDPDRLAAIVDYLDDLSTEFGKNFSSGLDAGEDEDGREWTGGGLSPDMYYSDRVNRQYQIGDDNEISDKPVDDGLGSIEVEFDTDHLVGDTLDDLQTEGNSTINKWSSLSMEGYKITGSFSASIENDDDEGSEEMEEPETDELTNEPAAPEGEAQAVEPEDDEIELIDGDDDITL